MGYFPNGTAGEAYDEEYCSQCFHQKIDDGGCMVWLLHLMHNYDDEHKATLDLLIPRSEGGIGNEQCKMFAPKIVDRRQNPR